MEYEFSKFYGYEGEDVKRWLAKLESFLILVGINRNSRAAAACLAFHLAGLAENWYCTLPEAKRNDFQYLKDALLEKFSLSDVIKFNLRCKLNSRKQGYSESLEDYGEFVCRTAQLIDISDSERLFCFVNGLRNDIKREVFMRTPKTYDEAFCIARHVEAVEQIVNSDYKFSEFVEPAYADPGNQMFEREQFISPAVHYAKPPYVTKNLCQETQADACFIDNVPQDLQSQFQQPCVTTFVPRKGRKRDKRTCFVCHQSGHIARNCQSKRFPRTPDESVQRNKEAKLPQQTQIESDGPKPVFLKVETKIHVDEHDNVEIDKETSGEHIQTKQEISNDNSQIVSVSDTCTQDKILQGVNVITASDLYGVSSYSNNNVKVTKENLEVQNETYEVLVDSDPAIVEDKIENIVDDTATRTGAVILSPNNSEGSKVDWLPSQSQVIIDAESMEPAAQPAICPGFPYGTDLKEIPEEVFTNHELNNANYVVLVLFLLILSSVARKRVARKSTEKINVCHKLLLSCNLNTIIPKELLWLWRKHERQKINVSGTSVH